ncbi:hypothetical protein FRC17_001636 [Serendipita sp. 399]|nr:hypothetical protein FRC17_001636 [Serendipita sp. 399]
MLPHVTVKDLNKVVRRLVYLRDEHSLVVYAKLKCYGWKKTEIDPQLWPLVRSELQEIWIAGRPPYDPETNPPVYSGNGASPPEKRMDSVVEPDKK